MNCWSLRCSWSIACRRCSNYIFIPDSTPDFSGLGKDNLEDEQRNIWVLGLGASYIRGFIVSIMMSYGIPDLEQHWTTVLSTLDMLLLLFATRFAVCTWEAFKLLSKRHVTWGDLVNHLWDLSMFYSDQFYEYISHVCAIWSSQTFSLNSQIQNQIW